MNKIEIRAAKSSLQTLIENCIGKAKRVLKHYGCQVVPVRSRDAIFFLYEIGLIDEEMFESLNLSIGFRNSMIHDYMEFDEKVLMEILKNRSYMDLYEFLIQTPNYNDTLLNRIKNFNI